MPFRNTIFLAAIGVALGLSGCSSFVSEGSADLAGIGGASLATAVTKNGAVAAGIGLGVQSVARAGVQLAERSAHGHEQDAIAQVAGSLPVGGVGQWQIKHTVEIESNERGAVTVSRLIGAGPLECKEIVFSVDTEKKKVPQRAFYVATVCRDGQAWKWASAEPATTRWGSLQ